ncbi:MAG: DUF4003 domain-containing protein [Clostridia bacterium]|nr:DUF4003 domain-containing protein [Clostridia bacterium]
MDAILRAKCDLLVGNKQQLNKIFAWESDYMRYAAAGILTCSGVTQDAEKFKYLDKLLKTNTGVFSELRGFVKVPLLCKMLMSHNPEYYLEEVQDVYNALSSGFFGKSEHKVLAAIVIVDSKTNTSNAIERTKEIYSEMTKKHAFLTSNEDYPLCAALAVSGKPIERLIDDMEESYKILTKKFLDKNAVQTLTHVLALDDKSPEIKCQRVIDIWDKLKDAKHKYSTGMELGNLGVLQTLDYSIDEIVQNVIDADDYLKTQKGFGNLAAGSDMRKLFASQVVLDTMSDETIDSSNLALNAMLATAIEVQIIMMICMTSAINAANTANT